MDDDVRSGSQLREELEGTLARNKQLEQELFTVKAERVLEKNGYEHVRPEDLAGVPLDKIEEKAKEIHEARQSQQEEMLRKGLEHRGWSEDEIEEFLAGERPAAQQEDRRVQEGFNRLRSLQDADSEPAGRVDKFKDLSGRELIQAHFEEQQRRGNRAKGRR